MTNNLSETVEDLLMAEAARRKRAKADHLIDETIEMAKAHYAEHGLWGEEFSAL